MLVAFRLEPRLARRQFVETLADDGQVGARYGRVQTHKDVTGPDPIAVARAQFGHDTPSGCCTFFTSGSVTKRPGATTAPEISVVVAQAVKPTTPTRTRPAPARRWRCNSIFVFGSNLGHQLLIPLATTLSGVAGVSGRSILERISSLAPKACMRPRLMTSR